MDFLVEPHDSEPVVTATTHLDLVLARVGLSRQDAALPENVLLPITPVDFRTVRRMLDLSTAERYALGSAGVYRAAAETGEFAVVGPAVGAPTAAVVLEQLAVLGARRVIAFGWCGSLQERLRIGSLVVPRQAIREEGTSYHYLPGEVTPAASQGLVDALLTACKAAGRPAAEGTVWTTDALYRETRAKVAAFGARSVLGVDMETSAIFAVATHLGLEAAVLLLVSDELAGAEWRVGFHAEHFRTAHQAACRVAIAACGALALPVG